MNTPLVLCYHAVSQLWTADLSVRADRLADQLELLARWGYRGVTFSEAVSGRTDGKLVAVTFDDAFHSVLNHALPILQRRGWPATIFVVTNFGDGGAPLRWPGIDRWSATTDEPELTALSWDELKRLQSAGWEIGSHTCSHPHLTRISDEQVRRELVESRTICEQQLGRPCTSIAYPYGDVDQTVVQRAREAGYVSGAALPAGLHPPHRLEWPRVGVYNRDHLPRFVMKASSWGRRVRTRTRRGDRSPAGANW